MHGVDYIEAKFVDWPTRTRATEAEEYVQNICKEHDEINITLVPSRGAYIRQVNVRFDCVEDRRVFIHHVRESPPAAFNGKRIIVKAVIPAEIAQHTDVLSTSVWYMNTHLSEQPSIKIELLPNYGNRELCLFDEPIVGYVNEAGTQIFDRTGGTACVFADKIEELKKGSNKRSLAFDFCVQTFVSTLQDRFKNRTILVK